MHLHAIHPRHDFVQSNLPPMPSAAGPMPVLICKQCGLMAAKSPKTQALKLMGMGADRAPRAQLCDGGKPHHTQVMVFSGDKHTLAYLLLPPGHALEHLPKAWVNLHGRVIGLAPTEAVISYVPHRVRRRPALDATL